MRSQLVFISIVFSLACFGNARRPPNYEVIERFLNNKTEAARYSDNLIEDARLDVPDLIHKYGYPVEVHEVVTEDGYILELHRIPYGRDANNQQDSSKPVVLVLHGLLASSADWVIMGPGTAFAYILAEAGFDVWLGNARGTYYSRRHVTMNPENDLDYWNFSWEEFGLYDLPAMIDYALNVTGKQRLHYIGHSQGTTSFWTMGSLRPEYNDKIITMQAFGPVAFLQYNANILFKVLGPFVNNIEVIFRRLGIGSLLSKTASRGLITGLVCRDGVPLQAACTSLIYFVAGASNENMFNTTMLPVKLAHTPAGAAFRQVVHYGQHVGKDFFRRFDHGPLANFQKYRSFTPPSYELHKITAPVYFHYAEVDVFADLRDLDRLWNGLGNPVAKLKVEFDAFSHIDFCWGQNAKDVLFDKTIDIMKSYPNN